MYSKNIVHLQVRIKESGINLVFLNFQMRLYNHCFRLRLFISKYVIEDSL